MVNGKAFVRIHEKGTGQTSYGGAIVALGSGTITLNAPNKNGEFELRLYNVDDGNWNAADERGLLYSKHQWALSYDLTIGKRYALKYLLP